MPGGILLEPLQSADYRRLWFGQLISVIGDKVDQIALGVLVYAVTGSALQMGFTLAISMLPSALFGMAAGALVDRMDRRWTMIVSDLGRAAIVVCVPLAAAVSIWLVYVLAAAVATLSLFFEPAKYSLIPDLVSEDRLMAANSLDNATVSVAELLGLAFAAGVVAALGYRLAFYFDAATYVASAVFIALIRRPREAGSRSREQRPSVAEDVREGLRYIASHAVLRHLLPIYAVAMTGVAASVHFVYVLALDRFEAGAPGLALLDGSITVGLLIGSVVVGHAAREGSVKRVLAGLLVFGALLGLSAMLPSIASLVPLFVVMGIANMFFYVPMTTYVQTSSAPEMRGRVLAAKQTISRVLSVAGFIGAGLLVEVVGLSPTILITSAFVLSVALLGLSRPHLRAA